MTRSARIAAVLVGAAVVAALVAFYVVSWVLNYPPAVQAQTSGGSASLSLETVAAYGHSPHSSWVSYFVKGDDGSWHHSTIIDVPAHTLLHVTIYNFDGKSGLRNPLWAKPRGVQGEQITLNGKAVSRDQSRRRIAHLRDPGHGHLGAHPRGRRQRAQPVRDAGAMPDVDGPYRHDLS